MKTDQNTSLVKVMTLFKSLINLINTGFCFHVNILNISIKRTFYLLFDTLRDVKPMLKQQDGN